jgi:ribose-phosphate pyrophosphokinase
MMARRFAARPDVPLAVADKPLEPSGQHDRSRSIEAVHLIGEVAGRNAVLVDDLTLAMGTLAEAADRVMAAGAGSVMAAVTLGVFAECSMERLDASPIDKLLVTDTVENSRVALSSKVADHLCRPAARAGEPPST